MVVLIDRIERTKKTLLQRTISAEELFYPFPETGFRRIVVG